MNPKISYIIASRNDNYCGDSKLRLLNTILNLHRKHSTDVPDQHPDAIPMVLSGNIEVIVVDWGSEVRLSNLPVRARYIHVPLEVTKQFKTPFNEVVALNIGIRRATGTYIARLDQDILIGDSYARWTTELPDTGWAPAYFSHRRELPEGIDVPASNLKPENFPVWGNWNLDSPDFYKAAVGIILAPRSKWHVLRGYNEQLIYRNHMEHDLCRRFKQAIGLENLGLILNADFYHQWHSDVDTIGRPQNIQPTEEILQELAERIKVNDENWGMGQHKFEEVVI